MVTDDEPSLTVALIRAYEWFDDALLDRMRHLGHPGMTRSHSLIYSYLEAEGSRPSDLARRIGISRQAVHRTIGEMVELGLLDLVADPCDLRAKRVVPTALGREQIETARQVLDELEATLQRSIGAERMTNLREALCADWGPSPTTRP